MVVGSGDAKMIPWIFWRTELVLAVNDRHYYVYAKANNN